MFGRLCAVLLALTPLALKPLAWAVRQPKAVMLSIHPRVGDTLRTRFEQIVRATAPAGAVGPTRSARRAALVTRASSMQVVSRSVIERSDALGTVILAITDSVSFVMPGVEASVIAAASKSMNGRRARMRVTPAGAMELLDPPRSPVGGAKSDPTRDVPRGAAVPLASEQAFARLPGTLPEGPVAIGTTWTREMALPWTGEAAVASGGRVEVVFRLDSLRAGGRSAYVSMRGSLARSTGVRGGRVATQGTMNGQLLVDLRRGWMTDSRATFTMISTYTPSGDAAKVKPVQLSLTVTQTLHCDP
jgi:hypothetical protein